MRFGRGRPALHATILLVLVAGCVSAEPPLPAQTPSPPAPPSEGLIAFVSDRDGPEALFLMRSDGSDVRRLTGDLSAVSHPAWSSDGTRIAFSAGSNAASDVYVDGR